ncbi:MAG: protein-(glutamine-N5) methyltransferase, release factor-specific [Flavobacteriaceae bacterium]|nr:protein-(glutamine-N5) methyltransferase, release factor-specific [Flavobacteriaceae bacterium]
MKLKQLKINFIEALSGGYPPEEIQSFFHWLAESYLGYSRFDVSVKAEEEVSKEISAKFHTALQRLQNHEPIQYIIGETEFYGLPFIVTPATLIPRPETEELVHWIIEESKNQKSDFKILDIGTGTGCIAVSLAKNIKNAQVSALDISAEAIKVAQKNAAIHKVEVTFFQADILKTKTLPQQYHVIVSNPPYVRNLEKAHMQPNVVQHEPESALFVTNEDPLLFYRKITQRAKTHLTPNGSLYFEINEYLSKEMKQLLEQEGFTEIELKKDMFGKYRMLKCKLPMDL